VEMPGKQLTRSAMFLVLVRAKFIGNTWPSD
jgi:hypothetical protein